MRRNAVLALCIGWMLASCGPSNFITSVPMVALTTYDQSQRRKQNQDYADKGDVYAQHELGESYCCNRLEGPLNGMRSLMYFCHAAKNGFAKSQLKLGKLYEQRETLPDVVVPLDPARAYMWYSLAARRGVEGGHQEKERMESFLPPDARANAEYMMSQYKQIPCEEDGRPAPKQ